MNFLDYPKIFNNILGFKKFYITEQKNSIIIHIGLTELEVETISKLLPNTNIKLDLSNESIFPIGILFYPVWNLNLCNSY